MHPSSLFLLPGLAVFHLVQPSTARRAPVELGDVNFVHTSDIHSWYLGHQKSNAVSRSWNANIGDVVSFVEHMKRKAQANGQDLFFIDSGDQTHRGGLSDADEAIAGSQTLWLQYNLPYDVMTTGNHELYSTAEAMNLYINITQRSDRYLASNVYIKPNPEQDQVEVPLAKQYRFWETANGRKVAALGVIYDFKSPSKAVRVETVADMVKEDWFKNEFLETDPDLFLLTGHMSVSQREDENKWNIIYRAIRAKYRNTPIFIFGGNSHNRDCHLLEAIPRRGPGRAIAVESGRYLETLGWVSANITSGAHLAFTRRYLDPNRETLQYHSGTNRNTFTTDLGKQVIARFKAIAEEKNLDEFYGCAPQNYERDMLPYEPTDENHILPFYMKNVIPAVVIKQTNGIMNPFVLIFNKGVIQGSIYEGPFTKNDKYVVTPFPGQLFSAKVPRVVAQQVKDHLLSPPAFTGLSGDMTATQVESTEWRPAVVGRYANQAASQEIVGRVQAATPGYVTEDRCTRYFNDRGGDDERHSTPLKLYDPKLPKYVESQSDSLDSIEAHDLVDVITVAFLQRTVTKAINALINNHNSRTEPNKVLDPVNIRDWTLYSELDTSDALEKYAKTEWQQHC